ncbi:MAG: YggT family protein [Pseudomonadota bacterium]|nr:YggT family protein [Pseudomonadota bacterium]
MRDLFWALHSYFISPVLTIFFFGLLVYVILGWLMIGGVVDNRNPTVRSIYGFLFSIIEPVAKPIRRFIPPIGGLDLSILVVALAIPFLRDWLIPRLIFAIPV